MLRHAYAVEYDFVQPTELDRDARGEAAAGPVSWRADQRHVRLRGSGGAGTDGGLNAARSRAARAAGRARPRRGLHRHSGRRSRHARVSRAVPHVHVARGASAASCASTTRICGSRRSAATPGWWTTSGGRCSKSGGRGSSAIVAARPPRGDVDGDTMTAAQALARPDVTLRDLARKVLRSRRPRRRRTSTPRRSKPSSSTAAISSATTPCSRARAPMKHARFPRRSTTAIPGPLARSRRATHRSPAATIGQAGRVPGVTPAAVAIVASRLRT